jgi:hypothetical protein
MQSIRARGQLLPIVGIVLGVMFTLGTAGANLITRNRPTESELRAEQRSELVAQREARIVELRAVAGTCQPASAHELARLLVMDGQWDEARAFAGVYELRCGDDTVVRHWGNAPRAHRGATESTTRSAN